MKEVFRVCMFGKWDTPIPDFDNFLDAIRYVRNRFPHVDFGDWKELPKAGNGDTCCETVFYSRGEVVGHLFHLELTES